MYFVRMKSRDIRQNLATEQYILNQLVFDEPVVLFYIQEPCVIIGRNQNVYAEIDLQYAKAQQIIVTRRLSGGGAVYDDLGNVSFSFVVQADHQKFGDFHSLAQPMIEALHKMGAVGAEISGRNDLLIDGKKFSGNAMYTKNKKMYMHGTLMFDVDLEKANKVLTVSELKVRSRATKSVRSRVTNIRPYLSESYQELTTEEFRDQLLLQLFQQSSMEAIADKEYFLTEEDEQAVQQLVKEIYGNDEWIYQEAPEFTIKKARKFQGGIIEAYLTVEAGMIQSIKIYGDYFSQRETSELEQLLIGCVYEASALTAHLQKINIDDYFDKVTLTEFISLLIDE